jgi:hypothetical protein
MLLTGAIDNHLKQYQKNVAKVSATVLSKIEERRKQHNERKVHFCSLYELSKNLEGDSVIGINDTSQPHNSVPYMIESNQRLQKLLQQKKHLTMQLQSALKLMDEDYASLFHDQGFEAQALRNEIAAATKDVIQVCSAYSQQLEQTLSSSLEEMKKTHKTEIEAVLGNRATLEKNIVDNAKERLQKSWKDFDEIKTSCALEKKKFKRRLEEDIENLNLRLQELECSFELKVEALDHGKHELEAQYDDKTKQIKCYRKAIWKKTDNLGKVVADQKETESKNQRTMKNLIQAYSRSARQYRAVELRLEQTEKKNSNRIQKAVHLMHESDIRSFVVAINNAESLILSDVLGLRNESFPDDDSKLM